MTDPFIMITPPGYIPPMQPMQPMPGMVAPQMSGGDMGIEDATGSLMSIMMMSILMPMLGSFSGSGPGDVVEVPTTTLKGYIQITTTPPGATILIDNIDTGFTSPRTFSTGVGTHIVTLRLAGYSDITQSVEVVANETISLNISFVVVKGTITINTYPSGATIYVGSDVVDTVSPCTIELQPGEYIITAKLSGYTDASATVVIVAGNNTPLSMTLTILSADGALAITSTPSGANIWVSGVKTGFTTPKTMIGPPGVYSIDLQMQGYFDYIEQVTLETGVTKNLDVVLIEATGATWTTPDGHVFPSWDEYLAYITANYTPIDIGWQ